MFDRRTQVLALIGGLLIHAIAGILVAWGAIYPYLTSYLHYYDSSTTRDLTSWAYSIIYLTDFFGMRKYYAEA